jgi:acyl-CoA thioesterase YciA
MNFHTRKLVKPEDLNPRGTLFGGQLLKWIDEEAAIYAMCQLDTKDIVTKFISEVNFVSPAYQGDVIKIGVEPVNFGRTSLTLKITVVNKDSGAVIVEIDKMVFVSLDKEGKPFPHGKTEQKF